MTRRIPTISREYGAARHQILSQLADIYTKRVQYDQSGEIPLLTLNKSADEHVIRPVLKPLGILDQVARKQNVNPNSLSYLAIIQKIHTLVKPNLYIELGVDNGACISLARCSAIGVDPSFEITKSLPNPTRIFRIKSDQFFDNKQLCASVLSNGIDLCFIDAMHLAEYVLRDFINVEKWANGNCVIILDDVYPEQIAMSRRNREFNAWCGDVYKIIPILLNYRPDLSINVFEAFIGPYRKGIAIISNLDHNNTILQENYEGIVDDILGEKYSISDMEDLEALISSTSIAQLDNILQRDRTSHSLDLF